MVILVIGGNGFIGTHFVDTALAGGARIRVLDRAGSLRGDPHRSVDYRYGDFSDVATLADALADADLVVHLASTTVPGTADLDPVADIQHNLVSSVRLLQQMRALRVGRLLYLSSGGTVYGNVRTTPVSEEHELAPLSSYGIVKVAIEHYIRALAGPAGIRALVLRPSNPYGPRQGHIGVQGVIPTFFEKLFAGDLIQIWGDGENIRDYLYIDDLIEFMRLGVARDLAGVFNVGSGQGVSVNDVLKMVTTVSGIAPDVRYLAARGYDVRSVVLDISKGRAALAWAPAVSLREGCERYWRWRTGG